MTRILLVDDVKLFRHLEAAVLGWRGYFIDEAESGAEAIEKIQADRPDLVIVDLCMQGMSGVELCRQIKQDAALAALPVLIVTASDRDEDIRQAIVAGCDDYLTKPLDDATLLAKVDDLLGRTTKRRFPRVSTSLQVSFEDFKGIFFEYTRDISRSGVFIEMENPLPIGSRLRLAFSLPTAFRGPVQAYGRVVRRVEPAGGKPGGVGITFICLDHSSKDLLDDLVGSRATYADDGEVFSRLSVQPELEPPPLGTGAGQLAYLRDELQALKAAYDVLQGEQMQLSARLALIESLHADLSPKALLSTVRDILANLLGVSACAFFVHRDEPAGLALVAAFDVDPQAAAAIADQAPVVAALRTSKPQLADEPPAGASLQGAIPFCVDGAALGVITIHGLYHQKTGFGPGDRGLAQLLSDHLGRALRNASARRESSLPLDGERLVKILS